MGPEPQEAQVDSRVQGEEVGLRETEGPGARPPLGPGGILPPLEEARRGHRLRHSFLLCKASPRKSRVWGRC